MAATAAAPTLDPGLFSAGNFRGTVRTVTGDASSYAAGGYPLTADSLGLRKVRFAIATIKTPAASAVSADAIPQADGSVLLRVNTATAEIANGVNMAALTVQVVAHGEA